MPGTNNNYSGIGFVTQGRDYSCFQKVAVSWTAFGGGAVDGYQPDFIIPFANQGLMLVNLTASGTANSVIEYSFNGTTVHGELNPTNSTISLNFNNRQQSCIWFRVQSGSSGTINVSVQAWGIR